MDTSTLQELQHNDSFCKNIFSQIERGNIQEGQLYLVRDNILKRYVTDGNNTYETTVIPRALIGQILKLAHEIWDIMEPIALILCLKEYIIGKA